MNRFLTPTRMIHLLWIIPLLFSLTVSAQNQTTAKTVVDNSKDSVLESVNKVLKQADSAKYADSMYKVMLLNDLRNLTARDQNKRKELEEKLSQVNIKDSLRKTALKTRIDSLKKTSKGYAVAPFGDTIFMVYTRIAAFTPRDRAENIQKKIIRLSKLADYSSDSLTIELSERSADILYNDMGIASITEADEMWMGKDKNVLAKEYLDKIIESIDNQRDKNSLISILVKVLLVLLIIAGIYLIFRLVSWGYRKAIAWIELNKDKFFRGFSIGTYEVLGVEKQHIAALWLIKIIRIFVLIIFLYIGLTLLFSIFPWTKGIADALWRFTMTPVRKIGMGIISFLPNLVTIIVIVFVFRYVIRFVSFIAAEVDKGALTIPGFYPEWAKPTFGIVKVLLYAFMFIMIFPYLPGSDSPIFKGVSVFLGVLFSLGSSSAIANAVAGLVITYMRPFKIGDRVKIGDVTGDVVEKSMLVTRIKTIKNEYITVPNASILNSQSTNYSVGASENGLILHTTITIGYDVPWRQVHELMINAALKTNGIEKDKKPFVFQTSLDDFYVSYQVNCFTHDSHRMAAIYSELHQNIQDLFNEAGVEIMSPHYRAARDGNLTTIPANYLPPDYEVPSFRVTNPGKK